MKTPELIALGLAGVALYFIVNRNGTATQAVNPANGAIASTKPAYWNSDFGSSTWSESINAAANARLSRQGSI